MGKKSEFFERISAELASQQVYPKLTARLSNRSLEDYLLFSETTGELVAAGEVKTQMDPAVESFLASWTARGGPIENLPEGSGTWDFRVRTTFSRRNLETATLLGLELARSNEFMLWDAESPLKFESKSHANLINLGVKRVVRLHEGGNRLYVHLENKFFGSPQIVPPIGEWLESSVIAKNYQNSLERLSNSGAPEKHFWLWVGDLTPDSIWIPAKFTPEELPSQDVELPEGVTHFWIGLGIREGGHSNAWLYTKANGWSHVEGVHEI